MMPRRSLYTEFGSKDGLFVEALRLYARNEGSVYRRHLGGSDKGWPAIVGYFDAMEFGPSFRGCFLVNSLAEREILPDEATETVDRFFDEVRRLFEENLQAAQHAGELRGDVDLGALAATILSFDNGLAIAGKHPSTRKELADAVPLFLDTVRE